MNEKTYVFGGHAIKVVLEEPWAFAELTLQQKELVRRLKAGEDIGIESVPADRPEQLQVNDALMGKEAMTREKWNTLSADERFAFRHTLDMQQYAPFEADAPAQPLFTLTVHEGVPGEIEASRKDWKEVTAVDEVPPFYYGYTLGDKTIYEYFPSKDISAGVFVLNADYTDGHYYAYPGMPLRVTSLQVNTSLMIQYTFASAPHDTLLLHASVTRYKGKANLFFGVSGTGKSTHSRLWHEYVPESDLMNDDNPIIRFAPDGECTVYGSPWSGKTLCYRNVQAPVNALVRLEQAPVNEISRLKPLQAYASVIAAVSTIRWRHEVMDQLVPTVERVAMNIPCFQLRCRPDKEAVEVCKNAII